MVQSPILFIIFNRPETTAKVFEAIRIAKPNKLFIAADGPRNHKPGEKELCEKARQIAVNVDWECEVQTLFRKENIGCGRGPAEAISWFFKHVDQGIILEDDCLPNQSFFSFCEELLNYYKEDKRIMCISGTNTLDNWKSDHQSYHFSNYGGIWGWATWRRAWELFDFNVDLWKDLEVKNLFRHLFTSQTDYQYRAEMLDKTIANDNVDWWDYQWHFTRLIQSGLSVVPAKNLITNIGFGINATHTFDLTSTYANLKSYEISFPLKNCKSCSVRLCL